MIQLKLIKFTTAAACIAACSYISAQTTGTGGSAGTGQGSTGTSSNGSAGTQTGTSGTSGSGAQSGISAQTGVNNSQQGNVNSGALPSATVKPMPSNDPLGPNFTQPGTGVSPTNPAMSPSPGISAVPSASPSATIRP
jgi:hypothetical protein